MPVGVRRSPSRLAGEVPRWPSHAAHGPAVCRQQAPRFAHRRSEPCVEARVGATTVINWVAEPVSSRSAKVGAHIAERSPRAEADAATASPTRVRASSLIDLQTMDDGSALARRACAPGAAVLPLGLAGDGGRPTAFLAPRLPGRAGLAAAGAAHLLGLRPPRSQGGADREREGRRLADACVLAALRGPLPDSAPAADRRLRRERRALARRRQHGCLQLPLRRRAGPEALVGARLRAGGGREPGREPLPRRRSRASARRARVPRPLALPARNGRSRRPARARLRGRRLAMGRALERLARLPALLGEPRLANVFRRAEAAEEPRGDPAQRLLAVHVTPVEVGQDRNRDAFVTAG